MPRYKSQLRVMARASFFLFGIGFYLGAGISYLVGALSYVVVILFTYFLFRPNYFAIMKNIIQNKNPTDKEKKFNVELLNEFGRIHMMRTAATLVGFVALLYDNFLKDS